MNFQKVIELGVAYPKSKAGSLEFLSEYYKNEGLNMFKADQLAEANMQGFIGMVQEHIAMCNKQNTTPLFLNIDTSIVIINENYNTVLTVLETLNELTWQEFEDFCGVLLAKCFNAKNVVVSQRSNDGGLDFSADIPFKSELFTAPYGNIELYGQAKKYTGNVGRVDVDKFTAYANRQKRDNQYPAQLFVFFTTSDFNPTANEEIRKNYFIGLNGMQISTLVFNHMIDKGIDSSDILKSFIE